MAIHSWWDQFGEPAPDVSVLPEATQRLVQAASCGLPGITLVEIRREPRSKQTAVRIDVEVERPQLLAFPIRAVEPVAIVLSEGQPFHQTVLALRDDFPDTPHQNATPAGAPVALCVDDRPWVEARLSFTAVDLIRRAQQWLSRAACGELHDTARPLDPLFFRATRTLVVPRSALTSPPLKPIELVGFVHEDQMVISARPLSELGGRVPEVGRLAVLVLRVAEQSMLSMRQPPSTLTALAHEIEACGFDLIAALRTITAEWAGVKGDQLRRLSSRIALLVAFPVTDGKGNIVDDLRAFITADTGGEIGVALGSLLKNTSGVGATGGYVKALVGMAPAQIDGLAVEPTEVHLAFDRDLAAATAGKAPDLRRAVLVGAGSLGSQVSLNLAREGAFAWTIVDNDWLMPHNLARHGLPSAAVGMPKAIALAAEIEALQASPAAAIVADVLAPHPEQSGRLEEALSAADVIVDASASVAAARHLSDVPSPARRISAFFNPAGTAAIVLTEAADRSIALRDLEAQYHRLIQTEPSLAKHLAIEQQGLRYSGSCRALTNRISASNAALLSALVSRGIREGISQPDASIGIWTVAATGEVGVAHKKGQPVSRIRAAGWELAYDQALLDRLGTLRRSKLPSETGGVLLGIADMSRRSIHLVHALPQPDDSVGSVVGFERGVSGLAEAVKGAAQASLHHIRYVGEWHSHPRRSSVMPSTTDIAQVEWLRRELAIEGLPAVMAIAGDDGQFSFVIGVGEGSRQ